MAAIEICQSILNEFIPAMIEFDPITEVELFKSHLTGYSAREYQKIAYKVSEKLYDHQIDVDHNTRICKFRQTEKDYEKFTKQHILQIPHECKFKAYELKKWLNINKCCKTARYGVVGVK